MLVQPRFKKFWDTEDELSRLRELAANVHPSENIVELGSYEGRATIQLLESSPEQSEVICVDLWELKGNPDRRRRIRERFDWNTRDYKDRLTVYQMNSVSASQYYANDFCNTIGLLFIDAGHKYHQVKADFEAWSPFVARNGHVAFHDYGHPKYPGVERFVEELLSTNQDYLDVGLVDSLYVVKRNLFRTC